MVNKNENNRKNIILQALNKMFFPENYKCIFCGKDISNFDEHPYCKECENITPFNIGNRCAICDVQIENKDMTCDFCQKHKRHFKRIFVPLLYEGNVKTAILKFKSNNKKYMATGFAALMANNLKKVSFDIITYVPPKKLQQSKRGYNQSQILAEKIGKILNLPVIETMTRIKDTREQKMLTFKERFYNLKNAFQVLPPFSKKIGNILLVDDVVTTCATVDACSQVLSRAGNNVFVCACARKKYIKPDKNEV